MNSRMRNLGIFVGGIALVLGFPFFLSQYYVNLIIEVVILTIFATAINLLVGYTGLSSLGQAAYLGTAAYTVGVLTTHGWQNPWLNALIAIGMAGVLSAVFGLLCVHTKGIRFCMITLALGEVIWGLAIKWRSITRGEDGLSGISRPNTGFLSFLADINNYYYFVCLVATVMLLIMYLIVRSPFGLSLHGIREDDERMQALGYNVWLHKYLCFVLSGLFCGVAGVLWVYYQNYVGLSSVGIMLATNGLMMPILGGTNFFLGPMLGAAVIIFAENIVSTLTTHWLMILGLMYVVLILFVPNGIIEGIRDKLRRK